MGNKLSYEQQTELTNALLNALDGQWDMVLPRVLPEIQDAITAGPRRHVDCILLDHGHGSIKDKFRITKHFQQSGSCICTCTEDNPIKNGMDLVMRVRGVGFMDARNLLMDAIGGFTSYTSPSRPLPPRAPRVDDAERIAADKREAEQTKRAIARIWNETVSLNHPSAAPALRWFEHRGVIPIKLPINELRFHPSLRYDHGDEHLGEFPAIIAMVRDNNGFSKMIHRTYITSDGRKPNVPKTRKNYSVPNDLTATGSAVRFDEPTNVLMLAEGIETALSARLLTGLPTWACLNANLLKHVEIPESVRYITVWADKDKSDTGQLAARILVERLVAEGRKAVALLPPGDILDGSKGLDWNDLLIERGAQSVRKDWQYLQWDKAMKALLSGTEAPKADAGPADDLRARAFTY